jgi:hypothetical protein
MTQRNWHSGSWEKAFPGRRDPRKVVQFMHAQWRYLLIHKPDAIDPTKNTEPTITEFFCEFLKNTSVEGGLTGYFYYETKHANIEPGATVLSKRIRTDIQYQFPVRNSPDIVHLVFEFKKLKNTKPSRKLYYGDQGMLRFISGYYASRWAYGFMVGLLDHDGVDAIKQLKVAIQSPAIASHPLCLKSDINGNLISDPSLNMPNLAHFDTTHSRSVYGPHSDLMLCHFFLEAP